MADCEGRLSPPSYFDELDEEVLDPRIQVELERLNKSSEEINKLELELDDARAGFRQALSESTQKLNTLAKKLGSCVEKARPYYDSRLKIKEAHVEAQKAAIRYERACSMHEAAKEMVQLAEQGYMCREEPSDPAWQEMLNHATMKVNEAEKERNESEQEHMRTTTNFNEADSRVQYLQKELKRAIAKSNMNTRRNFLLLGDIANRYDLCLLPYFEMKVKFNQTMEDQKRGINVLEEDVASAKVMYSEALRNLELISDDIHQQRQEKRRQLELGVRGSGVGSESPSPPPTREKGQSTAEGQGSVHTSSCQGGLTSTTSSFAKDSNFISHSVEGDSNFKLPSVIHTSPEMARSLSYREAIENRSSATESEDFPVPSMDDEFRALPSGHNSSHSDHLPETSNTVYSTSPSAVENFRRRDSREATPLSGSPSGGRKKLQGGLILKIDAAMDPLTQTYQAQEIQPTRHLGGPAQRVLMRRKEHSLATKQKSLEFPRYNPFGSPNGTEVRNSAPVNLNSPNRQAMLLVPGPSQETDDGSDTESIASTGPMLDDDQVELLTLEFSDQIITVEQSPPFNRQNWNRMSLPPKLMHLEQYIHQTNAKDEKATENNDNAAPEEGEAVENDTEHS